MTARTAIAPSVRSVSRPTLAAGWSLLAICALHTLAFSRHGYWDDWLAGPFRESPPDALEATQFWGLPGGFVIPGALLGLQVLHQGRRGHRMPRYVGWVLAVWALACLWVVGPSGFLLVLVPAGLLIVAGRRTDLRAPGDAPRAATAPPTTPRSARGSDAAPPRRAPAAPRRRS